MNSIIETLNQWGEDFAHYAVPMLWQSSLLIAAIYVFDLALRRKVRAAVRYGLWLVVLVKLLLPPTLALPTSFAWWLRPGERPQEIIHPHNVVISFDNLPTPALPPQDFTSLTPPPLHASVQAWLLAGSLIVSATLLLWLLVRWLQVSRVVRRAAKPTSPLQELLAEAHALVSLRSPVRLRITKQEMSPAVCGLFRPVILLPEQLAENLPASQLRAVLLHELTHLKRGDVWINCLQALLQIAYWWHPLVWVANARIRRVREEAVDDTVMLLLRDDADGYAPTLLEVAKLAFHRPLASLGLVGILESRSALRQRIERLMDFQMPKRAGLSFVSFLGIAAFTALAVPMGEGPARSTNATQTASNFPTAESRTTLTGKTNGTKTPTATASVSVSTNSSDPYNRQPYHPNPARQAIMDKLNQIRLERVAYDGLPLSEVVRTLSQVIKMRDPDSRGINFFIRSDKPAEIAPSVDPATGLPTSSSRRNGFRAIDPSTGLPGVSMIASSNEVSDINTVTVTINPAMTNALLRDVLEAIVKSSDKPIKYSILDFGIRFSPKSPNQLPPLSSRRFKINTNTFFQGLAKAEGISATSRQSQPGATTLSKTNSMAAIQSRVMAFFRTEGVNLDPPKSVFYGDRDGTLWVRATVEDLDIIEAAIQTLNTAPPQININVKWIEVSKKIADTLPTGLGFLPTGTNTSTVASLLNPPQLRELLGELQNKSGVTEINDTGVTTLSGLQAQVQVTDIPSVHEKLPGTKDTSTTIPLPFGPTLDVIAYVSADGYTIELTLIPTTVEILGYDDPGQFIIQAQSGGGTHGAGNSSLSVLPLPRFHLRQETISAKVWDGQTIVIDNTPSREKNPAAPGDSDRRLLILVTPCLIDPAGNRIHTDEELISRRATPPK